MVHRCSLYCSFLSTWVITYHCCISSRFLQQQSPALLPHFQVCNSFYRFQSSPCRNKALNKFQVPSSSLVQSYLLDGKKAYNCIMFLSACTISVCLVCTPWIVKINKFGWFLHGSANISICLHIATTIPWRCIVSPSWLCRGSNHTCNGLAYLCLDTKSDFFWWLFFLIYNQLTYGKSSLALPFSSSETTASQFPS